MRRPRGSRCTNRRIRSAACDTLSQPCVWRMLWLSRFPSGSVLRSIGSAGTVVPLFADFKATIPESDFSMPFIIGYGFLLSFAIPLRPRDGMETSQVPVQCVRAGVRSAAFCRHVQGFLTSTRSFSWSTDPKKSTPRDSDPPRHIGGSDAAFGQRKNLGIPDRSYFRCSIALPARAPVNA